MNGKVVFVGGGPGDPGLLTVKGMQSLQVADVVIYDRLVAKDILEYCGPGADLIFVGKSPGNHTLSQGEINKLLIHRAKDGKLVVRLKGGDPFVFGRGGEEAEALARAGVPFEIVPGVTSAVAVPAYAGIPVTHRDYASSFAVITGHEKESSRSLADKWRAISTAVDTLVFVMCMASLKEIVSNLIAGGRDPETPAAVIADGTRSQQETVVGTLGNIVEKADDAGIGHPAIAIVGEVVRLRDRLQWFESFGERDGIYDYGEYRPSDIGLAAE